jgi:hypothetical protein
LENFHRLRNSHKIKANQQLPSVAAKRTGRAASARPSLHGMGSRALRSPPYPEFSSLRSHGTTPAHAARPHSPVEGKAAHGAATRAAWCSLPLTLSAPPRRGVG